MHPKQKIRSRAQAITDARSNSAHPARGWAMLALVILAYSAIILLS